MQIPVSWFLLYMCIVHRELELTQIYPVRSIKSDYINMHIIIIITNTKLSYQSGDKQAIITVMVRVDKMENIKNLIISLKLQ